MKPIDVELYQINNCLVCKTNRVPEESWDDERGGYRIVSRGGWPTCFIGKNILRLCTTERDHDCIFYPTEAEALDAYNAYTAMIDEYNREHEEPEKNGEPKYDEKTGKWYQVMQMEALTVTETCKRCCFNVNTCYQMPCGARDHQYCVAVDPPQTNRTESALAPEFGERWIKDGFVWEACESAKRNEHTCSICDYNKRCGEIVCKACMYVKKIGPAITPGVFTDCTPGSGSLTGPERKTRIAEIYKDTTWNVPVVDGNERKGITVWAAAFVDKDFAGYEVRFPDGTKHTVAAPFVFVNDDGECSIESTDEYRHKSTLTGVAFLEEE